MEAEGRSNECSARCLLARVNDLAAIGKGGFPRFTFESITGDRGKMRALNVSDLWARRHLATYLSANLIRRRYRQTAIGFLWAIVRALGLVAVFSYLFGTISNLNSNIEIPFPLFVFCGVLAFDLFSNIVIGCANSIITNRPIVDRVYCPRLILPISAVLVAGFDFAIVLSLFALMFFVFGFVPSLNIVFAPLIIIGVVLCGFALGLSLGAVAVWFRDVRFAVAYVLQLLMLVTPVGYAASAVPTKFSFLVTLNPMAIMIEALRWSFFATPLPSPLLIAAGVAEIGLMLGIGFWCFAMLERAFADVI
jgi:homopolymeric O-antigen transport system permease protein